MRALKPFFLTLIFLPTICLAQNSILPSPAYLNPDLSVEQRTSDLVSRMTMDEKISQMVDVAPAIPRLNVPAYNWWNEGLHGVARSGVATVFPQAISLAATWDTDLIHRVGDVISTEARGKYNDAIAHSNTGRYYGLTFWSPNINIFRDPRWGRGQETYGEDPFLTGRLGIAFVTGLQGDDPRYLKVVATPKHYAVHSGPESLRHRFDVPVSLHDLYDTYTPAFRATVVEGHADSVMCAYNSIRGEPACANRLLLSLLRNNWGFRGYVVSDCWAINDLYQGHQFVMSLDQAAALSVRAGTDLSCGPQFRTLTRSLEDRLLYGEDIDRAVHRLFEARIRLGMFDPPDRVPWSKLSLADVDTSAHRELALQAARESIVLLKNDRNTLPLGPKIKSIAVVGPTADSLDVLLGNYNGTPSKYTTLLDGIGKKFPHAKVTYAVGAPLTESRALTVPNSSLRTGGPNSLPGLNAEFFANTRLEGEPVLKRIDPDVSFEWNNVSPGPGVPAENYSVRWTGELLAPVDGDYRLGASSDGGYRLYLDNKLLLDDWAPHGERGITLSVHLQAGHTYPIKLEYYHHSWESAVRLLWLPPQLQEQAVAAARNADVVIAVVGITSQLEGEESDSSDPGFFGGDRTDITLPVPQEKLLEALGATGKPLIVVLTSGSALAVNWANEHAAAILEAWYPGEEGGFAVADVLSGDYNPSGRLPVTFYSSVAQLPPFTDYSMFHRTYRYLNEPPLYPFGFGLSYATFAYSDLALRASNSGPVAIIRSGVAKDENGHMHPEAEPLTPAPQPAPEARQTLAQPVRAGDDPAQSQAPAGRQSPAEFPDSSTISVSVRVKNASSIAGDEVIELYVAHPGLEDAPIRSLAGFQRVHLAPGESREVTFNLGPRELSVVDAAGNRSVPVGPVDIWVGSSQPGPGANGRSAHLTINAAVAVPN